MYTIDTIKKTVRTMEDTIEKYKPVDVEDIPLCVSKGNRKIGHVLNVSQPPVITCNNCKECMHFCYDIKACMQYPQTVIDARIRNFMIMRKCRETYFSRIAEIMSRRRKNKYFRWHVAGDIIDYDYFCHMVKNARDFPSFKIWTYTKNYAIVNEYVRRHGGDRFKAIPSNFSIMFSEWDGMPLDNPYNFPVFTVKMKSGNKNHTPEYFTSLYKCPGNCDICKKLNRGCIAGESVYCDEH